RRYLKGGLGYLPVLIALRSVQTLERDAIAAERELLANRVSLYRAMGGDWSDQAGGARHSGDPGDAHPGAGAAPAGVAAERTEGNKS
ncbi:MAG: RND transporter, partial [Verrucomicrobia bacterium]|nr:RND transporter [Verrucomicrobiota bacterium]